MKKRNRIDSVSGHQEIVSGAYMNPIEPPTSITLSDEEREIWDNLIQSKARRAWQVQDLFSLKDLCYTYVQLNKLNKIVEDLEVTRDLNVFVKLHKLIDMLSRRAISISRYLQIHPAATQGKARNQVAQNQLHYESLEFEESLEEDGLIARPRKH